MRRNNNQRGRSGRGGGRGGHGGGGRGGRHGGGRGRGGRHQRRHPQQSAESGNLRERIAVESGDLVLIDQFMLANPQFVERMSTLVDEGPEVKNELIKEYGGKVINLERGTYRISRDPFAYSIIVHPEGRNIGRDEVSNSASEQLGNLFIDTRCLAMVDRELLDDTGLLEKYQQLWFSGQDKACRDLLRDNGGAVRYGFRRGGDELTVCAVPGENIVALWADMTEENDAPPAEQEAEAAVGS